VHDRGLGPPTPDARDRLAARVLTTVNPARDAPTRAARFAVRWPASMDYLAVRHFHEAAVALSIAGFFARGAAGLAGAPWARGRLARTLPHVIDTALLASALALVAMLRLNPFATPWLLAKLSGLVAYIGLGVVALRPSLSRPVRAAAWIAALAVAGWIVSVAVTKSPWGWLAVG
jgi:uncharacterized membrane protein SirB2